MALRHPLSSFLKRGCISPPYTRTNSISPEAQSAGLSEKYPVCLPGVFGKYSVQLSIKNHQVVFVLDLFLTDRRYEYVGLEVLIEFILPGN